MRTGTNKELAPQIAGLDYRQNILPSIPNDVPSVQGNNKTYLQADLVAIDADARLDALGQGILQYAAFGSLVSGSLRNDTLTHAVTAPGSYGNWGDALWAAPSPPSTNVGVVTSQDVEALQVDRAFRKFGIDGTGVKIGILSDSFAAADPKDPFVQATLPQYTSLEEDIESGDLPPADQITILADGPAGFSGLLDEGRAIAQLIHDIAPGADILFHTAFAGAADFANGILELAAAGADIIVDDVFYAAEPMFQDGIIAQAAAQVVEQGVAYFSSAGNSGVAGYEAPFRQSVFSPDFGVAVHDWDPLGLGDDPLLKLVLEPGQSIFPVLQWSEPYAGDGRDSATGPRELGPGSASDLGLFLFDEDGTIVVGSDFPNLEGDPVEAFIFTNEGETAAQYSLLIANFAGPNPDAMRIVDLDNLDWVTDLGVEHPGDFRAATTYGHTVAEGVIGVAAAPWFLTKEFNALKGAVPEPFTSLGGGSILFDELGNRLDDPEVREAVDVTATDGGNTTFFVQDSLRDADSFPNFFGTSAAAPNAAAVAALLLQANSSLTPAEIEQILEDTATDIRTPFKGSYLKTVDPAVLDLAAIGVERGFDDRTGAGLIDAFAAVRRVRRDSDNEAEERVSRAETPVLDGLDREEPASAMVDAADTHVYIGNSWDGLFA